MCVFWCSHDGDEEKQSRNVREEEKEKKGGRSIFLGFFCMCVWEIAHVSMEGVQQHATLSSSSSCGGGVRSRPLPFS
jgi:hypothetical protein